MLALKKSESAKIFWQYGQAVGLGMLSVVTVAAVMAYPRVATYALFGVSGYFVGRLADGLQRFSLRFWGFQLGRAKAETWPASHEQSLKAELKAKLADANRLTAASEGWADSLLAFRRLVVALRVFQDASEAKRGYELNKWDLPKIEREFEIYRKLVLLMDEEDLTIPGVQRLGDLRQKSETVEELAEAAKTQTERDNPIGPDY